MSNWTYRVFLPLVMAVVLSGALTVVQQSACPAGDCLLPDVTYEVCTPTPVPPNPHKWIAGGQVFAEAINAQGRHSWSPYISTVPGYESIAFVRDGDDLARIVTDTWASGVMPSDQLGGDSPYIIIFNEPGYPQPAGSEMSLEAEVLGWYLAEGLFPDAQLIVGNYSQENYTRIADAWPLFVATYGREPRVAGLGFHCYIFDGMDAPCRQVINYYEQFKIDHNLSELWMTEFGSMASVGSAGVNWGPAVSATTVCLDYAEAHGITRWFWYPYGFPDVYYTSALLYGYDLPGDRAVRTPMGELLAVR